MGITIDSIGLFENRDNLIKTSLELCRKAAEPCIDQSGYKKEDIGLVVSVAVYRDDYFCEPSFSSFVQNDLKINHDKKDSLAPRTISLDVLNGAMGFLNACQLSSAMIKSGKTRTGLVVSSDIVDDNVSEKGDPPSFHPSGAAMLLTGDKKGGPGFSSFYFKTFPEMQDVFESYMFNDTRGMTLIFKREPDIEDVYLRAVSRGVAGFLEKENAGLDDFDIIIPSQISPGFITKTAAMLGVERKKMIDVTVDDGDLFNASLPAAMDYVFKHNLADSGKRVLIVNIASGIQVGCAVYEF